MAPRGRFTSLLLMALLIAMLTPAATAGAGHASQPTSQAECKMGGWQDFSNAGFRNQGDCLRFVVTGVFVCRDPLGCVAYPDSEPLRLATALAMSGPIGLIGVDELRGVELAIAARGLVLDRSVELRNEDAMCTPEGGAGAATSIVTDPSVVAVVGTSCSASAIEAAPIISDAGYTMVSPSNTSPVLTDPDGHSSGYLRVSWNDAGQAETMAEFVAGGGSMTSAVVVDGGEYSQSLGQAFTDTFEGLGGTNVAFEVADPSGSDVGDVVAALLTAGVPDVLYMPVFQPLGSALVEEVRSQEAFDSTELAATDALAIQAIVDSLGIKSEGMLFTVPDLSFLDTPQYAEYVDAYIAEYGEYPLTTFGAFAFDAAQIIFDAVARTGITDRAGTIHVGRQALRDRLFATTGYQGLTGTITCDEFGQCGTTGFEVLTVINGILVPAP